MKRTVSIACLLLLSGCALMSKWHWEKAGASDAEYDADIRYCKTQTDQSIDGTVTDASVRRIHGCMQRRGWHRVDN